MQLSLPISVSAQYCYLLQLLLNTGRGWTTFITKFSETSVVLEVNTISEGVSKKKKNKHHFQAIFDMWIRIKGPENKERIILQCIVYWRSDDRESFSFTRTDFFPCINSSKEYPRYYATLPIRSRSMARTLVLKCYLSFLLQKHF